VVISSKLNDKTKHRKPAINKMVSAATQQQPPHAKLTNKNVLDVDISGLDDEGYGIAASESHPLRVSGALPGDTVRVGIDFVAQRIAIGHVKKILVPSAVRIRNPPCRHSAQCLGCPMIVMKYQSQTEWKQQNVQKQLRQFKELDGITVHSLISPLRRIHYRTTAKLVIAGKFSDPFIGIFRRSSHDVFDLVDCPVQHPLINRVIDTVRRGITKMKVPIYNPRSRMGLLRYLVIRISEAEQKAMAVLVTANRSYNELHHLGKFIRDQLPEVEVVAQNVNTSDGNVILGPSDHFMTASHHLTEKIGDVKLMISPRSFLQVNPEGALLIYNKVREWSGLTGSETVLDLYCGIGGIAISLASGAGKIIGLEIVETAVADASRNASINGVKNCHFKAGDVAELLEEIKDDGEHVEVIILNPPRKGCEKKVLYQIAAFSPRTVIYVSCSSQSLARDLSIMKQLGYCCKEIQPVDMFPQTMHVENVARLEKTGESI